MRIFSTRWRAKSINHTLTHKRNDWVIKWTWDIEDMIKITTLPITLCSYWFMNIAVLIQHRTRWASAQKEKQLWSTRIADQVRLLLKRTASIKVGLALQPPNLCYSYSRTGVSAGFSNSFVICARPEDGQTTVKYHYDEQERAPKYSHYQLTSQADGDGPDQQQFRHSADCTIALFSKFHLSWILDSIGHSTRWPCNDWRYAAWLDEATTTSSTEEPTAEIWSSTAKHWVVLGRGCLLTRGKGKLYARQTSLSYE